MILENNIPSYKFLFCQLSENKEYPVHNDFKNLDGLELVSITENTTQNRKYLFLSWFILLFYLHCFDLDCSIFNFYLPLISMELLWLTPLLLNSTLAQDELSFFYLTTNCIRALKTHIYPWQNANSRRHKH